MLARALASLFAALLTLVAVDRIEAQGVPVYHGVLSVKPATGAIDKDLGIASLRVKSWVLNLTADSNGIAPDKEPIIIAIGESEKLVIPAGQLRPSRNGKRFVYNYPKTTRGVRFLVIQKIKNDGDGTSRYRFTFSLVGIDLSRLVLEFPFCSPMAIIVGDDDGFSGVELDRPGGFTGSKVRVLGACANVADWPWI